MPIIAEASGEAAGPYDVCVDTQIQAMETRPSCAQLPSRAQLLPAEVVHVILARIGPDHISSVLRTCRGWRCLYPAVDTSWRLMWQEHCVRLPPLSAHTLPWRWSELYMRDRCPNSDPLTDPDPSRNPNSNPNPNPSSAS